MTTMATSLIIGAFSRAFAPETWDTWALVVVAVVAAYIAIKSLRTIEKQTEHGRIAAEAARDSAIAAKLNGEAVIAAERGWVLIRQVGHPPEGWRSGAIPGYSPGITLELNVYGNTPIKLKESRFAIEPLPIAKLGIPSMPVIRETPPDYSRASPNTDFPAELTIPPQSPFQLRLGRPMSKAEIADLNEGKTMLCAYGVVRYEDAFGKDRETRVFLSTTSSTAEACSGLRMALPSTQRDSWRVDHLSTTEQPSARSQYP